MFFASTLRVRSAALGHTHRDRPRLDFCLEMLDGRALTTIELVPDLAAQLHLDPLGFRGLDEGRAAGGADRCSCNCPRPLADALGIRDAELEQAVVRTRVVEDLDSAEQRADVPDEDAARLALVPELAVHLDASLEGVAAQMLRSCPDVRDAAEAVLEPAVGILDHLRVESRSRHDRESLAVDLSDVELALRPVQPDVHGLGDVLRKVEAGGEQVRRSRRDDRERDALAGEDIDAPLHHSVAAPDEDQFGSVLERRTDPLRRQATLRHLRPDGIHHTSAGERLAELLEPSTDRLAGVGDHGHLGHARSRFASMGTKPRRVSAAAPAARAANTVTTSAPAPRSSPAALSVRWCIPRYMRAQATKRGIATRNAQAATVTVVRRAHEASTSNNPPYSASAAAVWPDGKLASTGRLSRRSTS